MTIAERKVVETKKIRRVCENIEKKRAELISRARQEAGWTAACEAQAERSWDQLESIECLEPDYTANIVSFRQIVSHFPANLKSLLSVMVPYSSAVTMGGAAIHVIIGFTSPSTFPPYDQCVFSSWFTAFVWMSWTFSGPVWTRAVFCHVNIEPSLLPPDECFSSRGCNNSDKRND